MISYIGRIKHGGSVTVSDPCYVPEHLSGGFVARVDGLEPGVWHAFIDLVDTGSYGIRALRLYIAKEMKDPGGQRRLREKVIEERLGVDSGQMMICDSEAADAWPNDDEHTEFLLPGGLTFRQAREAGMDTRSGPDPSHRGRLTYTAACLATLGAQHAGILGGVAVVSSSGYGDGVYPLTAFYDPDDTIMALKVDFDPPGDEDEDEWRDEEDDEE